MQASNPDFLRAALTGTISTQGAELHSVYAFRSLLMYARKAGITIEGIKCLEIGASSTNGLALCLGLAGARHVVLNNIVPITLEIDTNFARNIALLCALVTPQKRPLEEVVDFSSDGKTCRLKPSLFSVLDNMDAVDIPANLSENKGNIDLIFSFSVLEHIRRLPNVLVALRDIASPQCVSIHAIDARDHTDFSNPLKYLYLSEEQFNKSYSEDHNRWRLPDYAKMMSESGWQINKTFYCGALPVLQNGNTDMYKVACQGPENIIKDDTKELPLIITKDEINKLDANFRHYSPEELSIVAFCLISHVK